MADFAKAGADIISVHAEQAATIHLDRLVNQVRTCRRCCSCCCRCCSWRSCSLLPLLLVVAAPLLLVGGGQ